MHSLQKLPVLPINYIFDIFYFQTTLDWAKAEGTKVYYNSFTVYKCVQTLAHMMPLALYGESNILA